MYCTLGTSGLILLCSRWSSSFMRVNMHSWVFKASCSTFSSDIKNGVSCNSEKTQRQSSQTALLVPDLSAVNLCIRWGGCGHNRVCLHQMEWSDVRVPLFVTPDIPVRQWRSHTEKCQHQGYCLPGTVMTGIDEELVFQMNRRNKKDALCQKLYPYHPCNTTSMDMSACKHSVSMIAHTHYKKIWWH